jgi:hypothetical protein
MHGDDVSGCSVLFEGNPREQSDVMKDTIAMVCTKITELTIQHLGNMSP